MNIKEKALYKAKANVFKALSHSTRLWITENLSEGEKCVCEFVKVLDVDFSTISKHLSILKKAGIVEDEKRGRKVYYRLKIPCILSFMHCVNVVIKSQTKA